MTHPIAVRKTLTTFFFLACFFVAGPAFAVSASVQVTVPGQQPKAFEGATVSLGGVTALVNSQGVATFENVPAGEQELRVTGRNIRHRAELVQVTDGAVINARATHVSALTSGGRFEPGLAGFRVDFDDWTIDETTKHSRVILTDAGGVVIFDDVFDDPTSNETLTAPSVLKGAAAAFKLKVGEVGGNSPWAAFYVTPMIGEADAEISFLPDPGEPGCDCGYSGSGTIWGIGVEAVIKPDAAGRFFFSIGFSYSETDTLDVNVAPGFPGVLVSAYTLEFEQNNATLIFGYDGGAVAPFAGIQYINGDARLTGDDTADAFVVDPTFFLPGDTLQVIFDNRFENDATLGVIGLNFRIPGTRITGLTRWAGDSENSQFDLQAFYTFGRR